MTIYVYQHKVTKLLTLSETACAGELWELIDEYDVPDPGEGGGGEGTTNYNQLTNKPQVNGVTLSGNKTSLELKIKVGDVDTLTTTSKDTTVAAINEHDTEIGNLANLTTTAKSDLVSSVNELDKDIGAPVDLTTTAKNNLVAAINEHDTEIGKLSNLTTAAKGNLVEAANELDKDIGDVSTLKTAAKTSLVAGLNELHDNVLEKDNTASFTPTTDYHPATKKYSDDIDKLIEGDLATVESTTKASKAYAAGDYLVYNHKLYCVKTAIAANGTITVTGTNANVTAKRVDEVIAELNAKDAAQDAEIAALATTGGVKNIVPNEGQDTFTQAGITFTKNADGSVTANGTATSTAIYRMKENLTLPKGKYVISGSPSGAADDKFFIQLHKQNVVTHRDTNNPIYPQEWDETGETVYDWYGVAFLNGTVADNMTFYPMIRPQGTSADYVKGMNPNPVLATQALADAIAGAGVKNKLKLTGLAQETKNGITCTINTDGTVTVDGTATADSYFFIVTNTKDAAWNFGSDYIMTGCPSGGSADTYGLAYRVGRDSDDNMVRIDWDYGSGVALGGFNAASQRVRVMVFVKSGQTVSNLVFSPMVRLAAITDDTYVPYAKDNATLTAEQVTNGTSVANKFSKSLSIVKPTVSGTTESGFDLIGADADGKQWYARLLHGRKQIMLTSFDGSAWTTDATFTADEDTGWQTATLATGQSGTVQYRKKNGMCAIYFLGFTPASDFAAGGGNGELIFTLPSGYAPKYNSFFTLVVADWTQKVVVAILGNGEVRVKSNTGATLTKQAVYGEILFMIG